jgi:hypothetical protein
MSTLRTSRTLGNVSEPFFEIGPDEPLLRGLRSSGIDDAGEVLQSEIDIPHSSVWRLRLLDAPENAFERIPKDRDRLGVVTAGDLPPPTQNPDDSSEKPVVYEFGVTPDPIDGPWGKAHSNICAWRHDVDDPFVKRKIKGSAKQHLKKQLAKRLTVMPDVRRPPTTDSAT